MVSGEAQLPDRTVMSAPGRATVDRKDYRAYIQSAEWRAVKKRYMASKLSKDCYGCGATHRPGFHLHHRTYKNLGNERLMDLVMLCPRCHQDAHDIEKEGYQLWWSTKHMRQVKKGKTRRYPPTKTKQAARNQANRRKR